MAGSLDQSKRSSKAFIVIVSVIVVGGLVCNFALSQRHLAVLDELSSLTDAGWALPMAVGSSQLEVLVSDSGGRPISKATVLITSSTGYPYTLLTDLDGRAVQKSLPAGEYVVLRLLPRPGDDAPAAADDDVDRDAVADAYGHSRKISLASGEHARIVLGGGPGLGDVEVVPPPGLDRFVAVLAPALGDGGGAEAAFGELISCGAAEHCHFEAVPEGKFSVSLLCRGAGPCPFPPQLRGQIPLASLRTDGGEAPLTVGVGVTADAGVVRAVFR